MALVDCGDKYNLKVITQAGITCQLGGGCELLSSNVLKVYPQVRGDTALQWNLLEIDSIRNWTPPIEVAVDYARVGVAQDDAWTQLADYAERDGSYTVSQQLMFGSEFNLHFRLRLRDALGSVYVTKPASLFDDIPPAFISTYREATRRWQQRRRLMELRTGVLLKRKRWGPYCTQCRDRDGNQQIKSRCLNCFDTGFVGGYYVSAACFSVEAKGDQLEIKTDMNFGNRQIGPVSQFLALNIPQVFPGDVWVDGTTDERWVFGSPMKTTMRVGNVQLFRSFPAARLDTADVVYDFDFSL